MAAGVFGFLDLVKQAHQGNLKLPAFQREWRWKRPQVILLYDSLRQGFPIGSFLFLKKTDEVDLSPREFVGAATDAPKAKPEKLVLDGQQRLTAGIELFYSTGPVRYFLDLNLLHKLAADAKVKLESSASVAEFVANLDVSEQRYCVAKQISSADVSSILLNRHLLCTSLLVDDAELQRALKLYEKQYPDREDFVRFVISPHFRPSAATQVPTTEIDNVLSVEGISRIFATLNTTGQLLTPFELVVATLYPKNIRLNESVKENREAFTYYKNIDESGDIFLQTIALFAGRDTKKASLPKTITEDIYREHSDDAFLWLDEAGKSMTEQLGVGLEVSSELLVYSVFFPPLAYVLRYLDAKKVKLTAPERARATRKLMRWFIGAVLSRRYQQSTHDRQLRDRTEIPKWLEGTDDSAIPDWLNDTYIPSMRSAKPEGALGKLLRCLMNARNPRDPLTVKPIGVRSGTVVTAKHHIFPTRYVPSLTGWDDKVDKNDTALNIMFLDQQTNISWLSMDPRQQLVSAFNTHGESKVRACLADQAISDECIAIMLRENKTRDDFHKFIEKREATFISILEGWGFRKPTPSAPKPGAEEDIDEE